MYEDPPLKADKGELHGSCNRTCCQLPGADYFNQSTRKYYCAVCADLINDYEPTRRDSMQLYGNRDLCIKHPLELEKKQ